VVNTAKSTSFPPQTIEFGQITKPGAYCVIKTGQLVRVPPDALLNGRSPAISFSGTKPMLVCPVSADPWIAIGKAREEAARLELPVRF